MLEKVLNTPLEFLTELVMLGFSEVESYLVSTTVSSRFTKHSAISSASTLAAG